MNVVRRVGACALVSVLVAALASPAFAADAHAGHDASGEAQIAVIQGMLDAAAPGDRIELAPDTYHGDLVIRKPVTLVGNGALVHGTGTGTVLTIRADGVVVEDISIARSAPGPVGSPAGIEIRGDDVIVRDVQIDDSYLGIAVYRSTGVSLVRVRLEGRSSSGLGDVEHHVASNTSGGSYGRADMAEGRGDGIALVNSEKVLVRDSLVTGVRDGIYLSFAKDVLLDGNRVDSGRYGVHSMYAEHLTLSSNTMENNVAGAVLMYGSDALVIDNHLSFNSSASTGFGLLAKDVTEIEVAKNVITHNRVGLHIEGPAGADLHEQRYVLNTVGLNAIGVALVPSAAATLSGNSFVENHLQVVPVGGQAAASVRWDEHGAGNYWSDYRGFDSGGDGVGDVAHRQLGVNSRTLEDNPALFALVGSPALNLTEATQQRWAPDSRGFVDELPLMEPHSPMAPAPARTSLPGFIAYSGIALASSCLAALAWLVLRSRSSFAVRRATDAVA